MSVHVSVPPVLLPRLTWSGGAPWRPTDMTRTVSGVEYTRTAYEDAVERGTVQFVVRETEAEAAVALRWLLWYLCGELRHVWAQDPRARLHVDRLVGVGDGTRRTWPLPLADGYTLHEVSVGGAPVTGYTLHDEPANLLDAGDAGVGATAGATATAVGGSMVYGLGTSRVGPRAYLVTPSGTPARAGVSVEASVSEGVGYTFAGSVLPGEGGTVELLVEWLDGMGAVLSSAVVASETGVLGAWSDLTGTATAPTGAVKARLTCGRSGGTILEPLVVSGLGVSRGDAGWWWAPGTAHGVLELATAPADGELVRVTATGVAFRPVRGADAEPRVETSPAGIVTVSLEYREVVPATLYE